MGELTMAVGMVLTALLVALSALALMQAWAARRPTRVASIFDPTPSRIAYLFDGERLIDASPSARALLPEGEDQRAWGRLMARFGPEFPNLAERLAHLPRIGQLQIPSQPGTTPLVLKAENLSGLTRLTVDGGQSDLPGTQGDAASSAALQQEVIAQRAILSRAPVLMWKEAADGSVI
jgi:hypothetical protein